MTAELYPERHIPCVECRAQPTVAFAHAGVEGKTGRVCADHLDEAVKAGVPVALDKGGVRNWT